MLIDKTLWLIACAIFQWVDGSAYSYRHHKRDLHGNTAGQFIETDEHKEMINIADYSSLLFNNTLHNSQNATCYAVVSNFVTSYRWVPVSESNTFSNKK